MRSSSNPRREKRAKTNAKCDERQTTHQLEMKACSKAFSVLSSDEAHDLLAKTFNFAVIQDADVPGHCTAAAKVLPAAALQNKSPRPTAISNANDGAFVFKASHLLSPSLSSLLHTSRISLCAQVGRDRLLRTRRSSPFPHKILVWKRQAPSSEEGAPDTRTNEPLIRRMPQPCQITTPRWGQPRTSSSPCLKACRSRRSGLRCNLSIRHR